jgi:hypothetical protein
MFVGMRSSGTEDCSESQFNVLKTLVSYGPVLAGAA